MKNVFVYPGCFAPPTYGHFEVMKRAAEIFPEIVIVCSNNEKKNNTRWFSEKECKEMWKYFALPKNVFVKTFAEYSRETVDFKNLSMIRGIRDEVDMENEKQIMQLNNKTFGINKFFYFLAEKEFQGISSSKVRKAAVKSDLQTIQECVPSAIATILLEKAKIFQKFKLSNPH